MNTPDEKNVASARYRRRRKWIEPALQLKLTLMVFSVAMIVLAINLQLNMLAVSDLINRASRLSATDLASAFQDGIVQQFFVAVCFVIPLAVWVGVIHAHKFCGPIYRLRQFFASLQTGRWDVTCRLRKGDELRGLTDSVNEAISQLTATVSEQQKLLKSSHRVLATLDESEGSHTDLLHELDREIRAVEKRLGAPEHDEMVRAEGATETAEDSVEREGVTAASS